MINKPISCSLMEWQSFEQQDKIWKILHSNQFPYNKRSIKRKKKKISG